MLLFFSFVGSQSYVFSSLPVVPTQEPCCPETSLEHKQPNVNTAGSHITPEDKEKMTLPNPELKSRDKEESAEPFRKKMKLG